MTRRPARLMNYEPGDHRAQVWAAIVAAIGYEPCGVELKIIRRRMDIAIQRMRWVCQPDPGACYWESPAHLARVVVGKRRQALQVASHIVGRHPLYTPDEFLDGVNMDWIAL